MKIFIINKKKINQIEIDLRGFEIQDTGLKNATPKENCRQTPKLIGFENAILDIIANVDQDFMVL